MALSPGTRLGPYEVTALIGAGGMGEVYKATDTNLKRAVAIKVLPASVVADAERLARFQREAEVLAALNHPHIASIYGLERSGGITGLVMELVEGEDLSQRIARGAIPLEEALPIAKQIAEALEAAHEQGIIHRDLKPANIKVRPDGTVKVLDFGLAKALEPTSARGIDATASPTITSPAMMTGVGVILGTAAYMSPEQARGKPVDKRADVWAFGCVLYEMLTGRRAFGGDELTDTLAFIITKDPDWTALPPETPAVVHKLLRRCLEKERRRRLADAADARLEIEEALTMQAGHDPSSALASTWDAGRRRLADAAVADVRRQLSRSTRRRMAALALGALVLAAFAGAAVWFAVRAAPPPVTRLIISTGGASTLTVSGQDRDLAITPDGLHLVYQGPNRLLVRALDQLEPVALSGLGAPRSVFVSPDGQWIGYFDGSSGLRKVSIAGGPPVALRAGEGNGARGATWGQDGTIVYATSSRVIGLERISSDGSAPTVLTRPDRGRGEDDHLWPEFLPGNAAVLFTITAPTGGLGNSQVAVLDLATGKYKTVLRGGHHAHYVPTGHLVYGASGTLRAVPFDLARLEVSGPPVPILDSVATTFEGGIDVAIAHSGTLAYVPGRGAIGPARSLVWVDRMGREEPLTAPLRAYNYLRLSPDGTRVALDVRDQDQDIWIWDIARRMMTRLTFDPGLDLFPVWTRDSRRILFSSTRSGPADVYWQSADGTGTADRLTESANQQIPASTSPDGRGIVVLEVAPQTGRDLLWLPLAPGAAERASPHPLIRTMFAEANGEISPDGRWLAYQSNEPGRNEIYVQPFPDVTTGRWQVSSGGGATPLWDRTGQELFYRSLDGAVMAVRVEPGQGWRSSPPTQIVPPRYFDLPGAFSRTFDVAPNGRRFVMIKEPASGDGPPQNIVVVQNWTEELKRLVPVD